MTIRNNSLMHSQLSMASLVTSSLALSSHQPSIQTLTPIRDLHETHPALMKALRYDNSSMVCLLTEQNGYLADISPLIQESECNSNFTPNLISEPPELDTFTKLDSGYLIACNTILNAEAQTELDCIQNEQNQRYSDNKARSKKFEAYLFGSIAGTILLCIGICIFKTHNSEQIDGRAIP